MSRLLQVNNIKAAKPARDKNVFMGVMNLQVDIASTFLAWACLKKYKQKKKDQVKKQSKSILLQFMKISTRFELTSNFHFILHSFKAQSRSWTPCNKHHYH